MVALIVVPEAMATAATDLAAIGSDLNSAHTAAATRTTGLLAAAEDEVSAAVAAVFSAHGQGFQTLGTQAAAFHTQFVQALNASAGSYASAEAQVVNTLTTEIVGAPAIPPVPATLNPTFTGTPSLASRIETAALYPVKDLLTVTGIYNQLGQPNSPFNQLLASTSRCRRSSATPRRSCCRCCWEKPSSTPPTTG